MFFVVFGILQAGNNNGLTVFLGGAAFWPFFLWIRSLERAGKEPLLSTGLFRNRTSNLGLVTQNIQWLVLWGPRSSSRSTCKTFAATTRSDGRHLHRGDLGILRPRSLPSGSPGGTRRRADPGRVRRHARRDRGLARPGARFPEPGLRAGPAADRPRPRRDADAVGERRAVELPGGRSRERSRASRAACPTSAPRSAPRSPARSSSPWSPSGAVPKCGSDDRDRRVRARRARSRRVPLRQVRQRRPASGRDSQTAGSSGGAGIRTQEALARPTVFKTAPFDRSGTPPWQLVKRKRVRPESRAPRSPRRARPRASPAARGGSRGPAPA